MVGCTANFLKSSLVHLLQVVRKVLKREKAGREIKLWLRVIRQGDTRHSHNALSGFWLQLQTTDMNLTSCCSHSWFGSGFTTG